MGKLEKLIEKILKLDKNLRFNELAKVLKTWLQTNSTQKRQ